ncbi:MAG: hypothetical protein RR313_11855 [Anaerovoracaceae bacterium]
MTENCELVVSVDESNRTDYSVISKTYKDCNHVISIKVYEPYIKDMKAEYFKNVHFAIACLLKIQHWFKEVNK